MLSKNLPNIQISDRKSKLIILSADKIRMQHRLKPVCSAKSYRSSILFPDKEVSGCMVSRKKEADQTVKTQHFPAGKTLTGLPSNANI